MSSIPDMLKGSTDSRPSYLPMSEDEDVDMEEPYSEEYHQKVAMLQLDPSIEPDDNAANMEMELPSGITINNKSTTNDDMPQLKIVSVCSLNQDTLQINDNSSVSDMTEGQDSEALREMLNPGNTKVFGIAKNVNRKTLRDDSGENSKDSKDDDVTKRKPRKSKKKKSKLSKLRNAYDTVYRNSSVKKIPMRVETAKRISRGRPRKRFSESEYSSSSEELISVDDDTSQPVVQQQTNETNESSKPSRRKTMHKPIKNDDDIIFVDEDQKTADTSFESTSFHVPVPSVTIRLEPIPKSPRTLIQEERIKIVRSIANPNADLLKKVAFLRCCVNYMMKELNRKPYVFHRYVNLNYLKGRYMHNKT